MQRPKKIIKFIGLEKLPIKEAKSIFKIVEDKLKDEFKNKFLCRDNTPINP